MSILSVGEEKIIFIVTLLKLHRLDRGWGFIIFFPSQNVNWQQKGASSQSQPPNQSSGPQAAQPPFGQQNQQNGGYASGVQNSFQQNNFSKTGYYNFTPGVSINIVAFGIEKD